MSGSNMPHSLLYLSQPIRPVEILKVLPHQQEENILMSSFIESQAVSSFLLLGLALDSHP